MNKIGTSESGIWWFAFGGNETMPMRQLSGGQKTLVSVVLIYRVGHPGNYLLLLYVIVLTGSKRPR